MNWYEKLNTYFPTVEMKSKAQLDALLSEKGDIYVKDEGPYHILMYAEFDTFIFIDFLLVSGASRGKGIGHQLMERLKVKNKPIILEVEPVNEADQDTKKRLHFYKREGFRHAVPIVYYFQALVANDETQMEILYWAKDDVSEKTIYENMIKVYEQIHSYKAETFYGYAPKPVNQIIRFEEERQPRIHI